jgi:hypothetical protein
MPLADVLEMQKPRSVSAKEGSVLPRKCVTHFRPGAGAVRSSGREPFLRLVVAVTINFVVCAETAYMLTDYGLCAAREASTSLPVNTS